MVRIGRSKTEYMHSKFSQLKKSEVHVRLDGIVMYKCKQFRYLGFSGELNGTNMVPKC